MSLLKRLEAQKQIEQPAQGKDKGKPVIQVKVDPFQSLKGRIHKRIVDEMSLEESKGLTDKNVDKQLLEDFVAKISNVVMDEETVPVMRGDRMRVIIEVVDGVLGFGPIDPLLKDDSVSE